MKGIIKTDKAPAALGPYSQAIKVSCATAVYCSGQIALDPETGELVGETAAEQCRQVMANLGEVLREAGLDFSNVVKTTIYMVDLSEFSAVNEVYAEYFKSAPPARMTVEVSRLPKDALVGIDAVAVV